MEKMTRRKMYDTATIHIVGLSNYDLEMIIRYLTYAKINAEFAPKEVLDKLIKRLKEERNKGEVL